MVWNYRELITCLYKIDVRAIHCKINLPLLITMSGYADTPRLRNDLHCVEWDVKL